MHGNCILYTLHTTLHIVHCTHCTVYRDEGQRNVYTIQYTGSLKCIREYCIQVTPDQIVAR